MRRRGGGWDKRQMRRFAREQFARPEIRAMPPDLQYAYVYALGCIYGSPQSDFYQGAPTLYKLPKEVK